MLFLVNNNMTLQTFWGNLLAHMMCDYFVIRSII